MRSTYIVCGCHGYRTPLPQDSDDTSLILGVNGEGIYLWNQTRLKENFQWPDVVKISYKRSRFRIRHAQSVQGRKKKEVVIIDLTCGDSRGAKRIWKTCIDQHTFFRFEWYRQTHTQHMVLDVYTPCRLREPPPRPRVTLPFQRNRYGFSGRTLDQMRKAKYRENEPGFNRTYSNRYLGRGWSGSAHPPSAM